MATNEKSIAVSGEFRARSKLAVGAFNHLPGGQRLQVHPDRLWVEFQLFGKFCSRGRQPVEETRAVSEACQQNTPPVHHRAGRSEEAHVHDRFHSLRLGAVHEIHRVAMLIPASRIEVGP